MGKGPPMNVSAPVSRWWPLVRQAAAAWSDDYAPSMGAALAYYTLFSMAPLLLIVISVAGVVFGQEAARGEIFWQLQGMLGRDGAEAIQGLLKSVSEPAEGALATVVGVVLLAVGATSVFAELQESLDRIWRAPARNRTSGIVALLRARLLSFGMILGIGLLLMVSLVLSAALSALGKWWSPVFGGWAMLLQAANFVVSFLMITLLFAMIYKIMPRVRIDWRDVWVGAAATSLLFSIGKWAIGLYIGTSGIATGFGAAGSLVVVLIWVYYSAQIFFFGAEFTWVYAHACGSRQQAPACGPPPEIPTPSRSGAAAAPGRPP